jgi:hypothetical protein
MHDALRGDVHAAMLARSEHAGSEKKPAEGPRQIGERGRVFLEVLKKVTPLPLTVELKPNISGVDCELKR